MVWLDLIFIEFFLRNRGKLLISKYCWYIISNTHIINIMEISKGFFQVPTTYSCLSISTSISKLLGYLELFLRSFEIEITRFDSICLHKRHRLNYAKWMWINVHYKIVTVLFKLHWCKTICCIIPLGFIK